MWISIRLLRRVKKKKNAPGTTRNGHQERRDFPPEIKEPIRPIALIWGRSLKIRTDHAPLQKEQNVCPSPYKLWSSPGTALATCKSGTVTEKVCLVVRTQARESRQAISLVFQSNHHRICLAPKQNRVWTDCGEREDAAPSRIDQIYLHLTWLAWIRTNITFVYGSVAEHPLTGRIV